MDDFSQNGAQSTHFKALSIDSSKFAGFQKLDSFKQRFKKMMPSTKRQMELLNKKSMVMTNQQPNTESKSFSAVSKQTGSLVLSNLAVKRFSSDPV